MNQVSDKQKAKNASYKKLAPAYLAKHPVCEFEGCGKASEQVHHKRGRDAHRTLDEEDFMAVCFAHHDFIEKNPKIAAEMGYKLTRHWTFKTKEETHDESDPSTDNPTPETEA